MTAILWHGNRLYADSTQVQMSEIFQSLNKIHKLDKPFHLTLSPKYHAVDDWIFGWVSTGTNYSAKKFVDFVTSDVWIEVSELKGKKGSKVMRDGVFRCYEGANLLGLATDENMFEVVLIGAQANYSFRLDGSEEMMKIYPHDKSWTLGSGGHKIRQMRGRFKKFDPVRMMQLAFNIDETSGGLIDVWELSPAGRKSTFERVGICKSGSNQTYSQLVKNIAKPYPLDWISNPESRRVKK